MSAGSYESICSGEPGTIGWDIHYFDSVGSTQTVAAELAAAGAAQGTAVIAETQTAGRGRMGRRWHSPRGANLYTTIVLRPRLPLADVPVLSLVAGVAVAEALETVARGLVALKWPNDVWLRGRKAGGIIAEAVTGVDQELSHVLLGIGLNINLTADQIPDDLRSTATSLRIETAHACDRIALAKTLFSRLNSRYMEWQADGFGSLRETWEAYSALTGRRVTVVDSSTRMAGVVVGIDAAGALILKTDRGEQRIVAGDVTIEGAYAKSIGQPNLQR